MKKVLIVGGGFAGITAALEIQKKAKDTSLVMVDRKDYFEITTAQLRALVAPDTVGDSSRILYQELLGKAFVQGEVARLDTHTAWLADGRTLSFDTLILAPGTRYPRFTVAKPLEQTSKARRQEHNLTEHARFRHAPGYLVIGGGVVGVELAAELAAYAPGKPVRLAHLGDRLVENLSPQASVLALKHLTELGVKVQLTTGNAKAEGGELVYQTISPENATSFLATLSPSVLDNRGRIQVDEFLAVKGYPDWYAVGDANDSADGKQAVTATAQGSYVAKAILDPASRKPYKVQPAMALVPLGKTLGFAQLPFGLFTWKFLVDIKRKDAMVSMFRKNLGLKG